MSAANQKANKPRLGRGLSSLISMSDLPVEGEVGQQIGTVPPAPGNPAAAIAQTVGANPPAAPAPTSGVNPPAGVPVMASAAAPQSAVTPAPKAESAHQPAPIVTPIEIPVEGIAPNPHQPRRQFDQGGLQALAASIKSTGLVQPIVVRRVKGATDTYQLVAGERRWRAAKLAGLGAIPAIIREVDAFAQAQMALVENIQREDLNPMDRAQAYRMLMDQLGLTQAELASRLGEDRSSVANYLRLLELAGGVKEFIRAGKLSLGHAKVLAGVMDPERQEELATRAVEQDLSVRNLERIIQAPEAPIAPARKVNEPSAHLKDLERTMTSQLGMRVQVRASGQKGKGKLVIHYTSLDQFDQIMERLGVKAE